MTYSKSTLLQSNRTYTKEDFLFFWGHQDRSVGIGKACLSQWYMTSFIVDGVCYNCAEQYMMAEKARIFGDYETRQLIMNEYSPMAMKKLGRKVRNFNAYVWMNNCCEIVKKGNLAKFSQNQKLSEFLLGTADKILAEASPKDTIWGIGLDETDSEACNPHQWRGENLLGFTLMEVRDILRGEASEPCCDVMGALSLWSMGAGNSARRFNGEDPMPKKEKIATADSWTTKPLTSSVSEHQDYYLTAEQMDIIRCGHIPDAMEDHWFMYCDENAIRYYRSWTGICFAEALYEKVGDEYCITELRINNNPNEYQIKDIGAAIALFYALLISEYGGDASAYWNSI